MKLRIKGNSLRLRISRTEMARLLQVGRIEQTVYFARDAKLTYALEHAASAQTISVRYRPQEVTVLLSTSEARQWAEGEQVGIYGSADTGHGPLALLVEKDFACLNASDADSEDEADAFPNPKAC
jgi:hypothetical protein